LQAAYRKTGKRIRKIKKRFCGKVKEKFGDKNTPRIFAVRFKKAVVLQKNLVTKRRKKSS
jgi:hypothetical protein